MSHRVKWNKADEFPPPIGMFMPFWWWDGKHIGMGHYWGTDAAKWPRETMNVIGHDGWQTGLVHDEITHWAEMDWPEPPRQE